VKQRVLAEDSGDDMQYVFATLSRDAIKAHPRAVAGGGGEGEDPLHQRAAAMAQLPQAANGLHPPKALLDEFPLLRTDRSYRWRP
jgi:hypothetical protein